MRRRGREAAHQHAQHVERGAGGVVPGRELARDRAAAGPSAGIWTTSDSADGGRRASGWPQASSRAATTTWGAAMMTQASQAAFSTPRSTGTEQDAHPPVALDRLEIVQHHDADGAEAVERRHGDDAAVGQAPRHHRGAGEPGQALVAERHGGRPPPAALLQAQRRRAVGPGQRQAQDRGEAPRGRASMRAASESPVHSDRDAQSPATRECGRTGSAGPVR